MSIGRSGRWLALAWAATLGAGGAIAAGAWNVPLEAAFEEPVAIAASIPPRPAPPPPPQPAVAEEPPAAAPEAVTAAISPPTAPAIEAPAPADAEPAAAPSAAVETPPSPPAEAEAEPVPAAAAEPATAPDPTPATAAPAPADPQEEPPADRTEALEPEEPEDAEAPPVQLAQAAARSGSGSTDGPAAPAAPRQRITSAPLPPPDGAAAAPAGSGESALPPPASLPSDGPVRAPRRVAAEPAPADAAARPAAAPQRRGEVALVLRGLGRQASATELAIQSLPPAATLAFAPGIDGLDRWIAHARARGHEIMLDLEEAAGGGSVQPVAAGPAGAAGLVEQALAKSEGLTGLIAGPRSSADATIRAAVRGLRGRSLLMVEPAGESRGGVARLASEAGLPVASGLALDGGLSRPGLDDRLREAEAAARRGVPALVIVPPRALAYERVMAWTATLSDRGITLVPVSTLAARRTAR